MVAVAVFGGSVVVVSVVSPAVGQMPPWAIQKNPSGGTQRP